MSNRLAVLLACAAGACMGGTNAFGQSGRDSALTSLRAAATAGNVDAELTLAGLLDHDSQTRNDEALGWYESAVRSGRRWRCRCSSASPGICIEGPELRPK